MRTQSNALDRYFSFRQLCNWSEIPVSDSGLRTVITQQVHLRGETFYKMFLLRVSSHVHF